MDTLLEGASSVFLGIANGIILLGESRNDQPWHVTAARLGDTKVTSTGFKSQGIEGVDVSIYQDNQNPSLNALILKPKNCKEPVPLIVVIHGGPHHITSAEFYWKYVMLVEAGYAIAGINYTS